MVWVSSLVIVGKVPPSSRLAGCLTVPAMTVKTEEKAGFPGKPSAPPSDKGTTSATDWSAGGRAGVAVAARSVCSDEEPEAS